VTAWWCAGKTRVTKSLILTVTAAKMLFSYRNHHFDRRAQAIANDKPMS
jgi:hypothetical protein